MEFKLISSHLKSKILRLKSPCLLFTFYPFFWIYLTTQSWIWLERRMGNDDTLRFFERRERADDLSILVQDDPQFGTMCHLFGLSFAVSHWRGSCIQLSCALITSSKKNTLLLG